MYKCFSAKRNQNRDLNRDDFDSYADYEEYAICKDVSLMEMCIKEVRESCIGFAQRQINIVVQRNNVEYGKTMPQCVHSMLAEEEEEKFPVFNKLVNELVLIKKLVNDQ